MTRQQKRMRFYTVLCGAVVMAVFALNHNSEAAIANAHQIHVVAEGETLWEIAEQYRPGEDPRVVIAEIEKVNGGLNGGLILPGEVLSIPVK